MINLNLTTMFQSSLVRVLIISVLGVAAFTSSGQPKILSGIIDSDTYLSESQYLITTNLKVTQNATLKVAPGTELIFGEGVVLKIEGGLDMQGGPNQFVKVKTESGQVEALGLEIWGSNTKTVTIAYTKFQNCIKPIDFKAGWYRSKSVVVHNQFTNVTSGEPGIVIHSPDEIINQEKMSLQFSYNSFWGNNSSIFVEGYDSDILDFEFSHNLLFGNHYYGASVGGVFTSPVYFLADANEHEAKKETQNNSVFFNNLLDGGTDTIIQENNLGLSGRAEKFAWGSNFMGIKTQVESLNEMDHFMNNSYSPFVDVESWLAQPDANVPGHIWKTEINAKHYKLRDSLPLMEGETVFTLHFNRSVLPKDTAVILDYTFYNEEDKVSETVQIPFKANWSENLSMLYATVQPESMPAAEHFYLSFSGLRDEEGFDVPAIHPGKNHYNKQMELIRQQELAEQEAAAGSTSPWDSAGYQQGGGRYPVDGLGIELTDKKNAKQMDSFIGSWLVGAFIGESIYFGDLTTENYPNPAFGHLALGIRLKYNANEKYSINGNFFYSNLSGTDHDGKNDHRNLHFRTVLYEASLQFEYHPTSRALPALGTLSDPVPTWRLDTRPVLPMSVSPLLVEVENVY